MGDWILLLCNLLAALFAFFVAAPCIFNAISLFGVQKKFNQIMVDEGIIAPEEIQNIHPKKQTAGVIIAVVMLVILLFACFRLQPWGFVVTLFPLLLGFWKFRRIVQFNSLTARKFYSTYRDRLLDEKKFDKYIKKNF
jgi:hypothetical protein